MWVWRDGVMHVGIGAKGVNLQICDTGRQSLNKSCAVTWFQVEPDRVTILTGGVHFE
jgi:hypothetical protein